MELDKIIENVDDLNILNSWMVANSKLSTYRNILCAVSGGSDSDILVHLCATLDESKRVTYVFYDTGLEFQATKNHIKYLESRYGITIETKKAVKPVPACCKQYGIPFLSKRVSDYMNRLQSHGFDWRDGTYEELVKIFPKCQTALKWWCNAWGETSRFNISFHKGLKEFIMSCPPQFLVSNKCCHYAKKLVAKRCVEESGFDLNITGVRRAEGGLRQTAYKNCFTAETEKAIAQYRPIFWYNGESKEKFKALYDIKNSDCYEVWGLKRTGCSGCPYARNIDEELEAVRVHEPKLYKALMNVFGPSYEYTRKYHEFRDKLKAEEENRQSEGTKSA